MREAILKTLRKVFGSRKGFSWLTSWILNIYCTVYLTFYTPFGDDKKTYYFFVLAMFYKICELIILKLIQIDKIKVSINK